MFSKCFILAGFMYGFCTILTVNSDHFLKNENQLLVKVKCGVFFEVWTEFLNII
jgi:hypothetical protein